MNYVVYKTLCHTAERFDFQKDHACNDFIDVVSNLTSISGLKKACVDVIGFYGYDYFIYAFDRSLSMSKRRLQIIDAYPDTWIDQYFANSFNKADPAIDHLKNHITPAIWKPLHTKVGNEPHYKKFLEFSHDVGLRNGFNIGTRGAKNSFGILAVGIDDDSQAADAHISRTLPYIDILSRYIHEACMRILNPPKDIISLTPRECEVLKWAANGKTTFCIAHILNISENTVLTHFKRIHQKLKVNTRQHAIARAVSSGMISI